MGLLRGTSEGGCRYGVVEGLASVGLKRKGRKARTKNAKGLRLMTSSRAERDLAEWQGR